MARRFVDLWGFRGGHCFDPPFMLPKIEYHRHKDTASR